MATPITWITDAGLVGTFTNEKFARFKIEAYDPDGYPLVYTLFSGDIPEGIQMFSTGLFQGVPIINEIENTTNNLKYDFAIKATTQSGKYSVRSFTLIINFKVVDVPTANIQWITPAGLINKYAEEEYVEFQLDAVDRSREYPLEYTVISGELTSGLQLFKTGLIQGIPVVEQTSTTIQEFGQTFTVRAKNSRGDVSDRTFSIIINSTTYPEIFPRISSAIETTTLGTFYDGYYLDLNLQAIDSNPMAKLEWTIIHRPNDTGLPEGVSMDSNGHITGYIEPFVSTVSAGMLFWGNTGWDAIAWDTPTPKAQSKTYRFTAKVFDGSKEALRTYTIFVQAKGALTADNVNLNIDSGTITADLDNRHKPFITTLPQDLPEQRQDSNFAFKFDGRDLDGQEIRYVLVDSAQGLFDQGSIADQVETPPGSGNWVFFGGGPVGTVPGVGFDQGPPTTADSFPPESKFDQEGSSLPGGLQLDSVTGWLSGHLAGGQVEERLTYTFYIYCYKDIYRAGAPDPMTGQVVSIKVGTYASDPVRFTLTILGSLDNVVNWSTPYDLGYIDNGAVSELFVHGTPSINSKVLNYRLKEPEQVLSDGFYEYKTQASSKLPQGLELTSTGLIVGRTTFEYFSLDGGTTTLDNDTIAFDYEYVFTVTASDETSTHPMSVSSDKEFRIRIKNYNKSPYENIYLRALPSQDQRTKFTELLNNTDIFPDELIYRPTDPWFGKAKDIKFLFAAGMNPNRASDYIAAMKDHHYNKRISLGNIKTAVALDANYNVRYEVVYVEADDPMDKVAYTIDRTSQLDAHYKTLPFTAIYPDSFENMKKEVSTLGYANRGALPDWMLNQQEDGCVLGFTRGVILAYTVPGASKLIAYRLQHDAGKFDFNVFDFVADRYQLDHLLSKNYNIEEHKFIPSPETTFDRLMPLRGFNAYAGTAYTEQVTREEAIKNGLDPIVDADKIQVLVDTAVLAMTKIAVDYAVSIPFDQINGKPLSFILQNGGLDGVATIKTGQYLIFAKQERFSTVPGAADHGRDPYDINSFDHIRYDEGLPEMQYTTTNDGWNVEFGLYGNPGYSETNYAAAGVVPGWNEKISTGTTNQRAGIWRVNVNADNIVFLEFVIETGITEYVQINNGQSHGDTRMYYDPVVKDTQTVPSYSVLSDKIRNSHEKTRFDLGVTRFFNNIDIYEEPETDDVFLKFPKFNVYR